MPISILPPAPVISISNNVSEADSDEDEEDKFDLEGDVAMTDAPSKRRTKAIITPGEIITDDSQWMR